MRGAALAWLASQAARAPLVDAPWQPVGPGLFARRTASSLSCVSTYTPSFLLIRQANSPGAGHAETLSRLSLSIARLRTHALAIFKLELAPQQRAGIVGYALQIAAHVVGQLGERIIALDHT